MGIGDDILATGMAKGAAARGKRIAFGDGRLIRWGPHSQMVFKGNPNIAQPGSERASDIEWINYYKGHRIYNRSSSDRWVWNRDFKAKSGEFYFDNSEDIHKFDPDLILIEPNVPNKACAPNKQWPVERWAAIASELIKAGFKVRQFEYGARNQIAPRALTPTFRHAAALLASARLAILPEGGLHHAAAAVGAHSVVLFGGFVPPDVLGYDQHINLTGGAIACGSYNRCPHCIEAMAKITIDDVLKAVEGLLKQCR